MMSRVFPEKACKKSNLPDANVEINSKDDHLDDLENQMNINDLPLEVLCLIIERLDKVSLFYCFFVCRRWRSIVFTIAHTGKGSKMWCFLYKQYLMDGFYQQNSNNCLLPFQESIESSLKWNYKCSISLSESVPVIDAVQMTVYRENIIVVTKQGVKYYDKKTFKIKKTICLDQICNDFIENDYMVARSIKYNGNSYKLQLFGKRSFDDCEWESQITRDLTEIPTTQELDVRLFKIEDNLCFAILKFKTELYSFHWQYTETPIKWHARTLRCRYYGGHGEMIAMHLGLEQLFLLTSSGGLFCFQRQSGRIAKVYTFSGVTQPGFVQLVHRNNVLLSVPDDRPGRLMRINGERNLGFPILYRFEIPRLTCVTEHGIFLFLGFSDGKVTIMRPMDSSKGNMNKHFIDLSVFEKGPPAPVVSIVVNVDNGKQSIFVATTSCVYRLTPTFPDEKNIWDKENLVGISPVPGVELVSI